MAKFACPRCGIDTTHAFDSRWSPGKRAVRRRRRCLYCGHRFTTFETKQRDQRPPALWVRRIVAGVRGGFKP